MSLRTTDFAAALSLSRTLQDARTNAARQRFRNAGNKITSRSDSSRTAASRAGRSRGRGRRSGACRTRAPARSPHRTAAPPRRPASASAPLLLETPALLVGVVQLAERVRDLDPADEALEALDQALLGAVRPCERRQLGRVVEHERGLERASARRAWRGGRRRACPSPFPARARRRCRRCCIAAIRRLALPVLARCRCRCAPGSPRAA